MLETVDYYQVPADIPTGTLTELLVDTVDRFGGRSAYMVLSADGPVPCSYEEVSDIVHRGAVALTRLGLQRGDRAAILSENRVEWALADFSCLCAGVIDVPIYSTLPPSQVRYILADSQSSLIFVADADQLAKAREAIEGLEHPVQIVVFDESAGGPGVNTWSEFLESGEGVSDHDFRQMAQAAQPDDTATLIYTSGTTGDPKGVMLSHNNLSSNVWAANERLAVSPDDSSLSFLPLSHVFQRMVDYLFFSRGCVITHCSIDEVSAELKRIRPTKVVSVPRLYEKVYQGITSAGGLKGALARWAAAVARDWIVHREAGRGAPFTLRAKHALADRLVFKKIRKGLGGRLKYFVSGGAPLSADINRFFHGAGVTILEGYGLSETSPVTNVNTVEELRIGTVGRPVPGTEIRIAEDGEILVRGPQVMKGYFGLPEKTAEVMDEEGWFSTGDIGELSEDGFLTITDRKKDLIKTSGGKYVAPQPIENRLKKNPFIDQAVVVGEGRKFCSVLVVPAFERVQDFARSRGGSASDPGSLLADEAVKKELADQVFAELRDLARFETPKKIGLLATPFTVENGSLTPTQKVKRKVVLERHGALIDSFYAPESAETTVFLEPSPAAP